MIEYLGTDPAALAPGRDHNHWYANAQAIGTVRMTSSCRIDFIRGRNGRQSVRRSLRRRGRYLVIEEPAFLVIVDEEHGLAENSWIRDEDVDNPGNVPLAEVRRPVG